MNTQYLSTLLKSFSVSGYEDDALNLFVSKAEEYGAITHIDVLNNAYAEFGLKEAPVTILIEAHVDEIGFQVCYIDDNGLVYVRRVGLTDDLCGPGSIVEILANDGSKVKGVVGKKPIHLSSYEETKTTPNINSLWIDTGLEADAIRQIISIGAPVCYSSNLQFFGDNRISSKGVDDKIGVFILTEAISRVVGKYHNVRLFFVASSQEEVGLRGAHFCASHIKPDYAISIDTDFATDIPDCPKTIFGDVNLGKGVVISKNLDSNRALSKMAEDISIRYNIPYQVSTHYWATGDTSASVIQVCGSDTRTLVLGIPCRYMHTPVEMVDIRDVESAVDLLEQIINKISHDYDKKCAY